MEWRVYEKGSKHGQDLREFLAFHVKSGFDTGMFSRAEMHLEAKVNRIANAVGNTLALMLDKGLITTEEMLDAAGGHSLAPDRQKIDRIVKEQD